MFDRAILARLDAIEAKTDAVLALLKLIARQETKIMSTVKDLVDAVAAETTVVASTTAAITGLLAQLVAAQATGDQAAFDKAVADITANTAALAAAIPQNTPAAAPPAV